MEPEVMEQLKTFSWPGNIRELANTIQQTIVLSKKNIITINDLPSLLFSRDDHFQKKERKIDLPKMVSNLEKKWILDKLKETEWNQEKAAKQLGITRKMLTNRIYKYHIKLLKNG